MNPESFKIQVESYYAGVIEHWQESFNFALARVSANATIDYLLDLKIETRRVKERLDTLLVHI